MHAFRIPQLAHAYSRFLEILEISGVKLTAFFNQTHIIIAKITQGVKPTEMLAAISTSLCKRLIKLTITHPTRNSNKHRINTNLLKCSVHVSSLTMGL